MERISLVADLLELNWLDVALEHWSRVQKRFSIMGKIGHIPAILLLPMLLRPTHTNALLVAKTDQENTQPWPCVVRAGLAAGWCSVAQVACSATLICDYDVQAPCQRVSLTGYWPCSACFQQYAHVKLPIVESRDAA